jgi:fructokinase
MTARLDVLSLGEALVDLLPSCTGPLEEVPRFERHPGGAPANVAVGVARLGGASAFVGAVGDDPFGRYLRHALAVEGVDVSGLVGIRAARTAIAFVALDGAGAPRFFSAGGPGAELHLSPELLAAAPIEGARILHFGSNLWPSESGRAATFAAIDRARAAGALVSTDPNLRHHLWRDPEPLRECLARALAAADLVKISSDECEFVSGYADPATAAVRLLERGPRLAVVTTGARGSVWARRGPHGVETGHAAAPSGPIVDTTGAGDGFMATLLTGLARRLAAGEDALALPAPRWERLLARASEAGTRVCGHMGAVAGLPRLAEFGSVDV